MRHNVNGPETSRLLYHCGTGRAGIASGSAEGGVRLGCSQRHASDGHRRAVRSKREVPSRIRVHRDDAQGTFCQCQSYGGPQRADLHMLLSWHRQATDFGSRVSECTFREGSAPNLLFVGGVCSFISANLTEGVWKIVLMSPIAYFKVTLQCDLSRDY